MNRLNCFFERLSNLGVGAVLFLIGLGFVVITITIILPFAFLVAMPVVALGFIFFFSRRSRECRIGQETRACGRLASPGLADWGRS